MSAWKSITAKASAIAVTMAAASRVLKMLPDRIEAFNEGKYAEAFLGKKWAKILDPDAYSDENTQPEASTEVADDATVDDAGNPNPKNTIGTVSPAQFLNVNNAMLSNMKSDGYSFSTGMDLLQRLGDAEDYANIVVGNVTPEEVFSESWQADTLAYFKTMSFSEDDVTACRAFLDNADIYEQNIHDQYSRFGVELPSLHGENTTASSDRGVLAKPDEFLAYKDAMTNGTYAQLATYSDYMDLTRSLIDAELYANVALGLVDPEQAAGPDAPEETKQRYVDYFSNLELSDEDKERYWSFIVNVDEVNKEMLDYYEGCGVKNLPDDKPEIFREFVRSRGVPSYAQYDQFAREKTDIASYENFEQYKDAFAQSSTPERSSALQFETDQLADIGKPASFDPSFDF